MGVETVGCGDPGVWGSGDAVGPGGGAAAAPAALDDPAWAAEWAIDLLMGQEAQIGSIGVRTASAAVRRAAERRTEAREKVQELTDRIRDAQDDASWWDRFCLGFGIVAGVLGALAGGAGIAFALTEKAVLCWLGVGLGAGSGAAGLTGALGQLGSGFAGKEASDLSAERTEAEQVAEDAGRMLGRERGVAEAVAALEEGMRGRAMEWLSREDQGRSLAAGAWLAR